MGTPVKRRGRPPGSKNKNTLTKEAARGPATSVKPVTTPAAGDRAVVAQKRKRDEYECDVVTFLRRGGISILEALAVKLPDVFAAKILPKIDVNDTLRLAQVNKAYNDAVWSVEGVRSMEAKIKAHVVKIGKKNRITEPLYWAAEFGNVPAVRARLESGMDVNKALTQKKRTALHVAAHFGHAAVVKALIEAGADVNKPASPGTVDTSGKCSVVHNITPVYFAAQEGHTHVVMELIKAGADVNQAISEGVTPLYAAAQNGHDGCVAVLIQAGADVRKAYKDGWTPMKIATFNKREKVVTLLKFYERV
jgi:ankyrin repeat protein